MKSSIIKEPSPLTVSTQDSRSAWFVSFRSWLFSWEIYIIVLVAGLLRLYGIKATEFDDDQAAVFRMAHDAVSHGMLVATSNIASIGIYNPPAIIYFFMVPAAFSANPLWGSVMVGVLMTLSVLLTYMFMRRYYGRAAATVASLLYAVAARPIFYSRFIWNQNLLPLFTMLFFFTLFRGAVERKKGWLGPAIFLLGILVQLHASSVMLVFPLALTLLLAPKTLRWRDLLFGSLGLLIAYFPYVLWEVSTHFVDVRVLLTVTKQPVVIDEKVWNFYSLFFSPYDFTKQPDAHAVLSPLIPYLTWVLPVMIVLLIGGAVTALLSALIPSARSSFSSSEQASAKRSFWRVVYDYILQFRATPYRCGLVVLLVWQIIPLLALIRHSIGLYVHYMIILMPGPFIFVGLLFATNVVWNKIHVPWARIGRYGLYGISALCVLAQLAGSTAGTLDLIRGNFKDTALSNPYYTDLNSLQTALHTADQVAQQHHFKRVYVSSDRATQAALRYLSGQLQTPVTVFDAERCVVLPPNEASVMLVGPYSTFVDALLTHFAQATIVTRPKRISGAPFRLYIVQPTVGKRMGSMGNFASDLQLLDPAAHPFSFNGAPMLVTRWRMIRSAQPADEKVYKYDTAQSGSHSVCAFTSMQAGDQVLIAVNRPTIAKNGQTDLMLKVRAYEENSEKLVYGSITFETYRTKVSPWRTLTTISGVETIAIPIAST